MQQNPKQIQSDDKNMLVALTLIILVLMGFRFFQTPKKVVEENNPPVAVEEPIAVPEVPIDPVQQRVVPNVPTVGVKNGFVDGKMTIDGNALTEMVLTQYRDTIAPDSPNVTLLSDNYRVQLGWNRSGTVLPLTQVQGKTLTPDTPLTFSFQDQGVNYQRVVSIDDHYLMTFVDTLTNRGGENISLQLQGKIIRNQDSILPERSVVHTGFVALVDNKLQENTYTQAEKKAISLQTKAGWMGMTDKYWQTIFIPEANDQVSITDEMQDQSYQSTFQTNMMTLLPGQSITRTTRLFVGAKDLNLINQYMGLYNIPKFDLTIDFGWFYFLTKPFLYFLQWLYALVGNMGVAILLFATLLRLALLPIATKSYVSMAQMKKIQPQIKLLQEKYKDDRMRLQQEMMALYKREKVNPAGGCLPMLIQIPVFFALYKVLSVSLQMRQAPFFGWVQDLSVADSSSVFTLFGLLPWPIPGFLDLGVWPVLMGVTMYIQQRLTPQPAGADKAQMSMFKWMPIIFTFMMGRFAVGLVIYWTWSNLLSILQQKYIMKKVK